MHQVNKDVMPCSSRSQSALRPGVGVGVGAGGGNSLMESSGMIVVKFDLTP